MLKTFLGIICVSLLVLVHFLISVLKGRESVEAQQPQTAPTHHISIPAVRFIGICTAIFTIGLPYAFPDDPYLQPALRCVCFFYACKVLDLSLAKSSHPPTLMRNNNDDRAKRTPARIQSASDRARYTYYLLTEMRYPSFDIAIVEKSRPSSPAQDELSSLWTWLPLVVLPLLAYFISIPETKALLLLLLIQLPLEMQHSLVHFTRSSCTKPLFYKPFAASSFSSFWATHWHSAAAPFLQSLAYQPVKRYLGRPFGVLATFNLAGIWHAWCCASIVLPGYEFEIAWKVWFIFMVMGVGVLAERVIWKDKQGGFLQRVIVWAVAASSTHMAVRTVECHAKVDDIRMGDCGG